MRILWNEQENYFQIESPFNWREELSQLKKAGFKTTGPPSWLWYTTKSSVLNKLRKNPPQSGLVITELAFQKYKFLDQQETTKQELKKKFEKLKQIAGQSQFEEYLDQELQVVCFVVNSADTPFIWDYRPPAPPSARCLGCDDLMYFPFDDRAYCVWCEKVENNT